MPAGLPPRRTLRLDDCRNDFSLRNQKLGLLKAGSFRCSAPSPHVLTSKGFVPLSPLSFLQPPLFTEVPEPGLVVRSCVSPHTSSRHWPRLNDPYELFTRLPQASPAVWTEPPGGICDAITFTSLTRLNDYGPAANQHARSGVIAITCRLDNDEVLLRRPIIQICLSME